MTAVIWFGVLLMGGPGAVTRFLSTAPCRSGSAGCFRSAPSR